MIFQMRKKTKTGSVGREVISSHTSKKGKEEFAGIFSYRTVEYMKPGEFSIPVNSQGETPQGIPAA